jgi:hypothetical protein
MHIHLDKNLNPEQIKEKLEALLKEKKKHASMADFVGKLKGVYGDGLTYQKKIRNEWD